MVELGQSGDHQGVEEPTLRCRAPQEGRRKPRATPGGMGSPRGPREGPQVSDPGGVSGLPGRGCGTPHHGCGRQQLAHPGLAQRPRPLALQLAQPAAATAPAPTQAAVHVMAQTADARKWGGELGPPTHTPPTIRRDKGARATSRGREGGDNERGGTANPQGRPRPASAARRRRGGRGAPARACFRV